MDNVGAIGTLVSEEGVVQDTIPGSSGFYMPAEWERHEGTWLHWPQEKLYRGYELKLERMWLTMVDVLHQHENVHLVVADERQRDHNVALRQRKM